MYFFIAKTGEQAHGPTGLKWLMPLFQVMYQDRWRHSRWNVYETW